MLKVKRVELTEGEKKEVEWWCLHHKSSVGYLTVQWRRYFDAIEEGDQRKADQIVSMMHAQLPAFERSVE